MKLSNNEKQSIEKLTCIVCPKSCIITVEKDKTTGTINAIHNAACRRGTVWVTQELLHPVRTVCSSVLVENSVPTPKRP